MIDKMALWSSRVERIWQEERPSLPAYDQAAAVRDQGYQQADPEVLCEHLEQRCERFAALVAALPAPALQREGVHAVFGPMTIRQCIQTAMESAPRAPGTTLRRSRGCSYLMSAGGTGVDCHLPDLSWHLPNAPK